MMTTRRSKLTEPGLDRVALSDEVSEGRLEDDLDGRREDEGRGECWLEDAADEDEGEDGSCGPGCTSAGDEYERFKEVHEPDDETEPADAELDGRLRKDFVDQVETRFNGP